MEGGNIINNGVNTREPILSNPVACRSATSPQRHLPSTETESVEERLSRQIRQRRLDREFFQNILIVRTSMAYPWDPNLQILNRHRYPLTIEEIWELAERLCVFHGGGLSLENIEGWMKRYPITVAEDMPTEEKDSCCICLEEYINEEIIAKLNCGHEVHFECVKKWLVEKNKCPLCMRKALVPPTWILRDAPY